MFIIHIRQILIREHSLCGSIYFECFPIFSLRHAFHIVALITDTDR
jgi:hypothetical protein